MRRDTKEYTILLVDDDPLVRDTLKAILVRSEPFILKEAENGVDALEFLEKNDVDIVITDIQMPRMGGIDLLRQMKKLKTLIPVAVVTGFPSIEIAVNAMKEGASDFLIKPFQIEQIELVIQKLIHERELLLENAQLNLELEQKKEIERLNTTLKRKLKYLSMLYKVGETLNESTLDRDALFSKIVDLAMEVTDARKCFLMLMDHERKRLEIKAFRGIPAEIAHKTSLCIGEGIAGKVAKERRPLLIENFNSSKESLDSSGCYHDATSCISVPLLIKGELLGALNVVDKTDGKSFCVDDMRLLLAMAQRAALCLENLALYESVYNNMVDTLRSLVSTIEAKDPYTKLHSARVTQWSIEIATALKLDKQDMDSIQFGGYLHDIGKIGVPDSILTKPGKLSREEYEIIKAHTTIGDTIVKPLDLLPKERTLIRHHHERWDGKGYPDGLSGEKIPFLARILAVSDAFDAMVTDRVYRKARSWGEALDELKRCSGSQFDPFIAQTFIGLKSQKRDDIVQGMRSVSASGGSTATERALSSILFIQR